METLKERIWRSLREPQKTLTTLQEKFNCQKIDKELIKVNRIYLIYLFMLIQKYSWK